MTTSSHLYKVGDLLQIPKDGENPYANHPGFDAQGCPAQYTVTPAIFSTSSHRFGCSATGGHCLPGEQCKARVKSYEEWLKREEQFNQINPKRT